MLDAKSQAGFELEFPICLEVEMETIPHQFAKVIFPKAAASFPVLRLLLLGLNSFGMLAFRFAEILRRVSEPAD